VDDVDRPLSGEGLQSSPCVPTARRVQDRLDQECMNLFDLMRSEEAVIPYSLRLLLRTIFSLTIGSLDHDDRKAASSGDTDSPIARDEIGVFYASSCAALFLRLICPSVISPLEWGALRAEKPRPQSSKPAHHDLTHGENLDISESVKRVEAMNKNPAAAAIILVAHVLRHDDLCSLWKGESSTLRALEQLTEEIVMLVPIDKVR
jgi:hypothetical protein